MVQRNRGGEDQQQIHADQRPRHRKRRPDAGEQERLPQQRVGEIGREADLAEIMESAARERVPARVSGEREGEQQRGEGERDARQFGERARDEGGEAGEREGGGEQDRTRGLLTPTQPERAEDRAAAELRRAAQQAEAGDRLAERHQPVRGHDPRHRGDDGGNEREQDGGRDAPPVDPDREQGEQQIREQLGGDRPGGMVPGQRVGKAPVLDQENVRWELVEAEAARVGVARRQQGEGERDAKAERHQVQRPDARDAAEKEVGSRAPALGAEPLGIGQPDHEARQEKEEIHREIALGERGGGARRHGDRQAQVEQHHAPGGDAAGARQRAQLGLHAAAGARRARRIGRKLSPARLRAR